MSKHRINRIRELLDELNSIREQVIVSKIFYTNGVDYFDDRNKTIKISREYINEFYEMERLRRKVKKVIPIIVKL
ncbi:MAG: hypothetical protein CL853_03945 [Crocinitomicaceae bacterium]|nr:hypothetical protein [Crocinitomicaceae bacterium]